MNTLSFGRFQLKQTPLQLLEDGRIVNLTARQLHVLALLARAHGEVVTREEFLQKVWGDAFVEEANLTQTVFLLRRALGSTAHGELIETVAKVGYRMAAHALRCNPEDAEALADTFAGTHIFRQYDLLLDSIAEFAIYMLDPSGRVRSWNAGAANLKGYTKDEIVGKHYSAFFPLEDVSERLPERLLARSVRDGSVAGEGWRVRKNGERFWASFVLTAIRNTAGRLIGFGKAVHDITGHKLREDALAKMEAIARQERDNFLAVAESSLDAIYICSAVRDAGGEIVDFTFTFLNANVEKMVSIPRSLLLGGSMCHLLPANRALGLFKEYSQVVCTGTPFVTEFPISADNVTSAWIRLRAVRLGDGVAITASDISEYKRMEQLALGSENQ